LTPQKAAKAIRSQEVLDHYTSFEFKPVSLGSYVDCWRRWITDSAHKNLLGLEQFQHADFVNGTSQTFDHFWLKYRHRRAVAFRGEFQYHACVNRQHSFVYLDAAEDLRAGDALIISLPFSDYGKQHPEWESIMRRCYNLAIPVTVDLAYWGISHDISLDLKDHGCIEQITCSLSKPVWKLENHRVGVRFSRLYNNDGISMINEVAVTNSHSMSLGHHFMTAFDCDWAYKTFRSQQIAVCNQLGLRASDSVIFGHGDTKYMEYNRGVPGNNRVCISEFLNDIDKENNQ
jgi:hypothetical protein